MLARDNQTNGRVLNVEEVPKLSYLTIRTTVAAYHYFVLFH